MTDFSALSDDELLSLAYPDKKLRAITLGKGKAVVNDDIADSILQADADMRAETGNGLDIYSSYRTTEHQKQLYDKLAPMGKVVAKPGKSLHEQGLALDIRNYDEAAPFLAKYGLTNDIKGDVDHFRYAGAKKKEKGLLDTALDYIGPSEAEAAEPPKGKDFSSMSDEQLLELAGKAGMKFEKAPPTPAEPTEQKGQPPAQEAPKPKFSDMSDADLLSLAEKAGLKFEKPTGPTVLQKYVTNPATTMGVSAVSGLAKGTAGVLDYLADIAEFAAKKTDPEERKKAVAESVNRQFSAEGVEVPEGSGLGDIVGDIVNFLGKHAGEYFRTSAQQERDLAAKVDTAKKGKADPISEFVGTTAGEAAPGIVKFIWDKYLAPVHGYATGGIKGAITEGGERAIMGTILKGTHGTSRPVKSAVMGTAFAGQAAAHGGSVEDILKSGLTGVIFGATSPGGELKVSDVVEMLKSRKAPEVAADLQSRGMDEKAASDLVEKVQELIPVSKSAKQSAEVFQAEFDKMQSPEGAELLKERLAKEQEASAQPEPQQEPEPTVPERADTLQAQVDALAAKTIPVVMFPTSTPKDSIPEVPKGMKRFVVSQGPGKGTYYYNPEQVKATQIMDAATNGTHGELLGNIESKPEAIASGGPVVVQARKGETPVQDSLVSPEKAPEQAEVLARRHPEAEIVTKTPAEVISERVDTLFADLTADRSEKGREKSLERLFGPESELKSYDDGGEFPDADALARWKTANKYAGDIDHAIRTQDDAELRRLIESAKDRYTRIIDAAAKERPVPSLELERSDVGGEGQPAVRVQPEGETSAQKTEEKAKEETGKAEEVKSDIFPEHQRGLPAPEPWQLTRREYYGTGPKEVTLPDGTVKKWSELSKETRDSLRVGDLPEAWRVNQANINNVMDVHGWNVARAISQGHQVRPEVVEPYAQVGADWARQYLATKFKGKYPQYETEIDSSTGPEAQVPPKPLGPLPNRFEIIKQLRDNYGLSLKEAADLVHGVEQGRISPEKFRARMEELKDSQIKQSGKDTTVLLRGGGPSTSEIIGAVKPHAERTIEDTKALIRETPGKVRDAVQWTKDSAKAVWDAWKSPPKWTEFKDALGKYDRATQESTFENRKFLRRIREAVPNKLDREGITNWIQADGDAKVLQEWADKTTDSARKKGYEAALKLSPEAQVMADEIKSYFDKMEKEGNAAGVLKGALENYVNQMWKRDKGTRDKLKAQINAGILNPNFQFGKNRFHESYFAGEQAGLKPLDKDIGYLVGQYHKSFSEAIAARNFIKSMLEGTASDGRPLVTVSGKGTPIPSKDAPEAVLIKPKIKPEEAGDYMPINHPALRDWKWVANVETVKPESGVSVDLDPDTFGGVKNAKVPIFLQGDMYVHPEAYQHLKNVLSKSAIRENPVGKATLRGVQELKSTLLSLSGFHQVQEGLHAVFHKVNPANAPEIDFKNPTQRSLVEHGLMVSSGDALSDFAEGLHGSGLINKVPGIGHLSQKYGEYLFQDYIPRLKMKMAVDAFERNMERYQGKYSRDQILELTAKQSNAAFGELNYKAMGRNPTVQDALRLLTLAPDFLEARMKFVGQALKPGGREQGVALIRGALGLYAGGLIANMIFNNGDPKFNKPFTLVLDGKDYSLRSVPGDILHLIKDPRSFIYHRLNPTLTRTMVENVTGRDIYGHRRDSTDEVKDFFLAHVPIPAQGFTEKREKTLLDSVLTSMGINAYKHRSDAEQLITDMAKESSGMDLSPADRKIYEIKKRAEKFWDDGDKEKAVAKLNEAVSEKQLTTKQKDDFLAKLGKPSLYRRMDMLPVEKALQVWAVAEPAEKEIIKDQVKRKIGSAIKNPDDEKYAGIQEKAEDALKEIQAMEGTARKFTEEDPAILKHTLMQQGRKGDVAGMKKGLRDALSDGRLTEKEAEKFLDDFETPVQLLKFKRSHDVGKAIKTFATASTADKKLFADALYKKIENLNDRDFKKHREAIKKIRSDLERYVSEDED